MSIRESIRNWLTMAMRRDIVRGALGVSLVVGAILNLINQSERLRMGLGFSVGQLVLNFLVPYLVATWSGARAVLRDRRSAGD